MNKNYLGSFCALTLLINSSAFGQYAADAFRYSEIDQTGSARFQAIGGNHAALGGDPSSIHGNPAGLGFYSRSELTISPGFSSINSKSNYFGENYAAGKNKGNLAQASLVIASQPGFQRRWKRSSVGISFSRQQSFQSKFSYLGLNPRSSSVSKIVEDVNANKTPVTQLENDFEANNATTNGPLAFSVPSAYYWLYLINPGSAAGPNYTALDSKSVADQFGRSNSTGANTQWTIAYAGNLDDKFYIGGNIGFNRLKYTNNHILQNNFIDSPDLLYVDQTEDITISGSGFNASLGVIYKFNPVFQLGGTLISPTMTFIRETFRQNVSADYVDGQLPGPDGTLFTPEYNSIDIAPNEFEYTLISPFRGNLGATFFLKDKGFVTGTVEYVGYSGMGVRTKYLNSTDNASFRNDTKAEIKSLYRNTVNVRLGAELRAGNYRFRVGGGYLADPYVSRSVIDRSKLLGSAGLGYRNNRFFVDLSGTVLSYKTTYTPYELNDVEAYSSVETKQTPVNVVATFGVLF